MNKALNVINFYVACNSLKDKIYPAKAQGERNKSYAENIYSQQMLALAIYSENENYKRNGVDISKVMYMLAVSEIESDFLDALTYGNETKKVIRELDRELDLHKYRDSSLALYANRLVNVYDHEKDKRNDSISKFYAITNRLVNVIRTGWKDWHVQRERLESVAEHIFGTQMLALAIYSEYREEFKDIDIMKVIYMIAIHELGETIIGDLTRFQISKEEKKKIEEEAVNKILDGLLCGEEIKQLFLEFDNRSTKEGMFSHLCDKLECDLQSKLYDEENCVDLNHQEGNSTAQNPEVLELFQKHEGETYKWSRMWLEFWQRHAKYTGAFLEVSNYAMNNEISIKRGYGKRI